MFIGGGLSVDVQRPWHSARLSSAAGSIGAANFRSPLRLPQISEARQLHQEELAAEDDGRLLAHSWCAHLQETSN